MRILAVKPSSVKLPFFIYGAHVQQRESCTAQQARIAFVETRDYPPQQLSLIWRRSGLYAAANRRAAAERGSIRSRDGDTNDLLGYSRSDLDHFRHREAFQWFVCNGLHSQPN